MAELTIKQTLTLTFDFEREIRDKDRWMDEKGRGRVGLRERDKQYSIGWSDILRIQEVWLRCGPLFFFINILNLFFHKFKTLHVLKVQSKGRERRREKVTTKQVLPLYNHICYKKIKK